MLLSLLSLTQMQCLGSIEFDADPHWKIMDPVPNQDQGYFQKLTESLLTKPNFWVFFRLVLC